jgi:hypothetical protein
VCKEHLDLLTAMARLYVSRCRSNCSCDVSGIFVENARHLAHRRVRAAARLQFTAITVLFAGTVKPRPFGSDARPGCCIGSVELLQLLTRRADVAIILGLP